MKRLASLAAALAVLVGPSPPPAVAQAVAANPAPQLYVYEGAGCDGRKGLAKFENMLGRKVDGVVDFNDYTQTPPNAVANLNWDLGCWQGNGRKLAISIGLGFNGASTADIAAGKYDSIYEQMGAALVAHGFQDATIRLGWEMNGGWYPWGQKGGSFGLAFSHISAVLHATPGSNFTIGFNPTAGLDPSSEAPAAGGMDELESDQYANAWNCGGCKQQEPDLYNGNKTGWWGNWSFYPSPSLWLKAASYAVPELGVGGRADGHGACSGTGWNDCDDGFWLKSELSDLTAARVKWLGFWDYNASDYRSQVSNGTRPAEALELLRVYGSGSLPATLQGATLYTGTAVKANAPAGYHTVLAQLANGHVLQIAWGEAAGQTQQVTDLSAVATAPTPAPAPAPSPTKPAPVSYPATISNKPVTATISPVGAITIVGDGSEWLAVQPPQTVPALIWTYNVSPARRVGTSDKVGGAVAYLNGGQPVSSFVVDSSKGASQVFYIDKQ